MARQLTCESWALSIVPPSRMREMLRAIRPLLCKDAELLLRDYADGDMAQERFEKNPESVRCSLFLMFELLHAWPSSLCIEEPLTDIHFPFAFLLNSASLLTTTICGCAITRWRTFSRFLSFRHWRRNADSQRLTAVLWRSRHEMKRKGRC